VSSQSADHIVCVVYFDIFGCFASDNHESFLSLVVVSLILRSPKKWWDYGIRWIVGIVIVTGRKKPRLRVRLFLAIDKIGEWLVHGSILSFVYTFTNHSPTICDGLPMVFCIIFFQIFQGAIGRAIPAIPLVWSDPTRSVCNKQEAVVTLYDKGSMGERRPHTALLRYAFAKGVGTPHVGTLVWE